MYLQELQTQTPSFFDRIGRSHTPPTSEKPKKERASEVKALVDRLRSQYGQFYLADLIPDILENEMPFAKVRQLVRIQYETYLREVVGMLHLSYGQLYDYDPENGELFDPNYPNIGLIEMSRRAVQASNGAVKARYALELTQLESSVRVLQHNLTLPPVGSVSDPANVESGEPTFIHQPVLYVMPDNKKVYPGNTAKVGLLIPIRFPDGRVGAVGGIALEKFSRALLEEILRSGLDPSATHKLKETERSLMQTLGPLSHAVLGRLAQLNMVKAESIDQWIMNLMQAVFETSGEKGSEVWSELVAKDRAANSKLQSMLPLLDKIEEVTAHCLHKICQLEEITPHHIEALMTVHELVQRAVETGTPFDSAKIIQLFEASITKQVGSQPVRREFLLSYAKLPGAGGVLNTVLSPFDCAAGTFAGIAKAGSVGGGSFSIGINPEAVWAQTQGMSLAQQRRIIGSDRLKKWSSGTCQHCKRYYGEGTVGVGECDLCFACEYADTLTGQLPRFGNRDSVGGQQGLGNPNQSSARERRGPTQGNHEPTSQPGRVDLGNFVGSFADPRMIH